MASSRRQDPAYIAYYRVSTDRQGDSGLGLEAQRASVTRFLGGVPMLAEFQEIESGKSHRNRPRLAAALEECRRCNATLVIAKLDRLARDVHFISGLIKGGVDFVAVDMPHANRLTIHILAAVAEHEREAISERTRAALGAARARGTRLGNPRWAESIAKARAARNPVSPSAHVIALMNQRRTQGKTYRAIAAELNHMALKAPRGGPWHDTTVRRAIVRFHRVSP